MTPLAFQPFKNALYPCLLLGTDGVLHRNEAAETAGAPLSDEKAMTALLRTSAQQMAASGTAAATRPLLADALRTRSLTILATDDGTLAVAAQENEAPVTLFSSQMREPLTNIFATLPLLNAHVEEHHLRYTEDIQANCYQLLRLACNLEDAGLVENKSYDLHPLDLTSLVDSLCIGVSSVCRNQHAKLEWSVPNVPVIVCADPRLISSALLNIIRNSLAYTRDGNIITVKLTYTAKNALLTVEDKGLGILEENVTRIFEPYFSIDPYGDSNIRPGVGLGLPVVREAVNAFGGTASAESRFGEGTSIFLTLPLDGSATEALSSDSAQYMLNRYSPIFVQLCGHCLLPGL